MDRERWVQIELNNLFQFSIIVDLIMSQNNLTEINPIFVSLTKSINTMVKKK